MNFLLQIVLLSMKRILIQNVLGNFRNISLFIFSLFLYRHIELTSTVANTKYIFTTIKYGSMAQGKIGFNTLQVRYYFFEIKKE
jgi:hypothetical protein